MDLISIIMPVFNSEKFIKKTIQSILNQTYQNFEIIIVNDDSTDKTENICVKMAKEDSRIKYFHIPKGGVSKARNYALSRATGNYLMFIDADDYYEKNMLEEMYKAMIEQEVDVVRCTYKLLSGKKVSEFEKSIKYDRKNITKVLLPQILSEKIKCYVWLLLIKKSKVGIFEEKLFIYEDFCFYLEMLKNAESIYMLDKKLYNYNDKNINSLTKKNLERNIYNMILAERKISKLVNNEELLKIIDTRIVLNISMYIIMIMKNSSINYITNGLYEDIMSTDFKNIKNNYCKKYLSIKERIYVESIFRKNKIILFLIIKMKKIKEVIYEKYKNNNIS